MPEDFIVTAKMFYIRFHGTNYSSDYTNKEIEKFAQNIKNLEFDIGFAYFNNDINAYAPYNALLLKKKLD